jgi:hypothetical protein
MTVPRPPAVSSLTVDDIDGVPDAAALLATAHYAHPTGRLLGSITDVSTDYTAAAFMAVVRISKRRGHVDLIHHHGQIAGVACWITHPAHRRTHTPPQPSGLTPRRRGGLLTDVQHSLDRLDMLDLALDVPADSTHLHLACLGTQAGYNARMFADLLLHHQHQRADHNNHTLHIEAHHHRDLTWLRRTGYHDHGPTLGHHPQPQSNALTRNPQPYPFAPHPSGV